MDEDSELNPTPDTNYWNYIITDNYWNEYMKKDKDIVMTAVKQHGDALKFADESMQKDKDIIMASFTQNEESDINVLHTLMKLKIGE